MSTLRGYSGCGSVFASISLALADWARQRSSRAAKSSPVIDATAIAESLGVSKQAPRLRPSSLSREEPACHGRQLEGIRDRYRLRSPGALAPARNRNPRLPLFSHFRTPGGCAMVPTSARNPNCDRCARDAAAAGLRPLSHVERCRAVGVEASQPRLSGAKSRAHF